MVPQPGSVASSGPSSCLPAKEISCVAALLLRHHPRLTCSSVTESGVAFRMINLYVNQRMLFKANLPVLRSSIVMLVTPWAGLCLPVCAKSVRLPW